MIFKVLGSNSLSRERVCETLEDKATYNATINSDIADRVVILNFAGDESFRFRFVFEVGRRRAAAAARGPRGLKIWKIGFSGYSSS